MDYVKQVTNDLIAALTALTRLPLYKWVEVPKEHYQRIIHYWSIVGWLTGSLTAGIMLLAGQFCPTIVAVAVAFTFRIIFTGAMHEDGLMDFFDGFGGGHTRERILTIMKDSHTGAFAVIGFVCYALIWILLLGNMPLTSAVVAVAIGDPMSKFVASNLARALPYARKEEEAKMGVRYESNAPKGVLFITAFFGLFPMILWSEVAHWMLLFSALTFGFMVWRMKAKIGGYTGDCCGATFLLCEVMSYLAIWIVL